MCAADAETALFIRDHMYMPQKQIALRMVIAVALKIINVENWVKKMDGA